VGAEKIDSDVILKFRKAEGSDTDWTISPYRVKTVDVDKPTVFDRGDNISPRADERKIPSAVGKSVAME